MGIIEQNINNLHITRQLEFEETIKLFPKDAASLSLLEIGSGTGFQLQLLKQYFGKVTGIEIRNSNYDHKGIDDIIEYDGSTIPFPDNSFDVVFSSNTMEHVIDLDGLEAEMKRVLKPGGICIHIIPSHHWKCWNIVFHYPALGKSIAFYFARKKAGKGKTKTGTLRQKKSTPLSLLANVIFPPLHGERGNRFTEIYYFRPAWWTKHFQKNNWHIQTITPTGVYYSGHYLSRFINRKKYAAIMGSSCYTFILQKK